jgi:ABC-type dipeptide/oligopeptide/nickel transport system ATPase component
VAVAATKPGINDFSPGWGERWAVHEIERRLEANRNIIVLLIGESGSGKSWAALRLAEQVDPGFNAKRRLVFTLDGLMALLNAPEAIQPGDVVVWDEAGIGASARQAMTKVNVIFSAIVESVRFRRFALLFTVPDLAMIDPNARRMCHLILESKGVDEAAGKTTFKPFYPKHGKDDTMIPVYPVLSPEGRPSYQLRHISITRPSKALSDEYEILRAEYIAESYASMHESIQTVALKAENDRTREELRAAKFAAVKERAAKGPLRPGKVPKVAPDVVLDLQKSGMTLRQIAEKVGLSVRRVAELLREAKTGYIPERGPRD